MTLKTCIYTLAAPVALSLCACATAPRQQLTNSKAGVRAAEEVGAAEDPRASFHLQLAQDQIAAAEPLVDGSNSDRKIAADVLARASADADLAVKLAQTAELRRDAKAAANEVRELQNKS